MKRPRLIKRDRRIWLIQGLLLIWVGFMGWRLVSLQVNDHDWLQAKAERQQQANIELSPMRGVIFDRNGSELARSVEVKSLYASPSDISDPDDAADRLAEILDVERDLLYKRLTSQQVLIALKRKLSKKEVEQVERLSLDGLRFVNEMKRYYVADDTAAHILGFVDIDEKGAGGLELSYDKLIRGRGGRLQLDVDALKKSYDHSFEQAQPGANVTLTIDTMVQHYAEEALAAAVRASRARGGTVVVLKPKTGEVLALASYPAFNPNRIAESTEENRSNRAVEYLFEPGSIFKLVTYSAALEEGVITPETLIECPGQIKVGNQLVHDTARGTLTATQALAKSSNVAAIKIGMMLGKERLAGYIERFGFGKKTGIELPAESRGMAHSAADWTPTSIAAVPIGHEIGVTAVQAASAFACIANGGEWVQPHLVSRVSTSEGDTLDAANPDRRRVVSERTAMTLKAMLESVVLKGTGKAAQITGYRAAGKTGTAQKLNEATGRYWSDRFVASFAGFAPVDHPEIACVVSIDDPIGLHHGGDVAAPVFARVVSDTLRLLGVPAEEEPQRIAESGDQKVYELRGLEGSLETSSAVKDSRQLLDPIGKPEPAEPASNSGSDAEMPDLVGRSFREAAAICGARGLRLLASGDGIVAEQNPRAGALIGRDGVCMVKLARQPRRESLDPPQRPAARTF
jgi:cell division protein FtsI/penicillin-binding protein 2